jgi:hypothetical protein
MDEVFSLDNLVINLAADRGAYYPYTIKAREPLFANSKGEKRKPMTKSACPSSTSTMCCLVGTKITSLIDVLCSSYKLKHESIVFMSIIMGKNAKLQVRSKTTRS